MMVLNAASNDSSGGKSMLTTKSNAANNMRRRRSKGTIAGFAFGGPGEKSGGASNVASSNENGDSARPAEQTNSATGSIAGAGTQPQHSGDAPTVPPKPCHAARLVLMCCQNAIRMGARTQLGLCPPGRARKALKLALRQKTRSSRIARNRNAQNQPPVDTGGYFGVDKMLGPDLLEDYVAQEEDFLVTTNTFDAESEEEASSGDDDELYELDALMQEDSPALDDEKKYFGINEPLFTPIGADNSLANSTGGGLSGPMVTGKLPFNRRKLRYFDSVLAGDRMSAREYLTAELRKSKQREVALLAKHLKRAQRRERRRIKEEKGLPLTAEDLSDSEEASKDLAMIPTNVSQFDHAMLPSTAAALILESLALNPLESIEGMAKCYDGIVAAGVALLDSTVGDPTSPSNDNERRSTTRAEVMSALTPLLITSLEQPSGDVILALARIRKKCGTPRYQRRFVQRVAPSLIRPPNGAVWCLKHQNDMEPILAAAELIFDSASELFSKGWFDRGQLLLADSKRAETLNAAAMQLQNLRTGQGDGLTLGSSLGGHTAWRTSRMHCKDGGNDALAEWEVIAVDRQIRISISNIMSMDWTKPVVYHRDAELAKSYHRSSRAPGRRNQSVIHSSPSGEMSPKTPASAALSPARPSHSKTATLPASSEKHEIPKTEPSESPFTQNYVSNEPSDPRSKSPVPLAPASVPSQPTPMSPPPPNRTSSGEMETRISSDPFSSSNSLSAAAAPPRSPSQKSPKRPDADVSPAPQARLSPSYSNSWATPVDNQAKQSISGPQGTSPGPPQAKSFNPVSPSSVGTPENMPARFMSSVSSLGSSMSGTLGTQPAHYRMLTSTAAERKRTVAACRALRAQITRFEEAFHQLHGRYPKGAVERAPLATTYAQYREWKRAIRADAACRIQALFRGSSARWRLLRTKDPKIVHVINSRAGRQKPSGDGGSARRATQENVIKELSIPAEIGQSVAQASDSKQTSGVAAIGPDGFPTQSTTVAQTLAPQWGDQVVRRRSGSSNDGFGAPSPVPRPISSPSSGASVSSSGSGEFRGLSLSELQARKRELKQQLKQYDMSFARRHGRMPVKAEKEPIRHLYERYNALKSQINAMEQEPSGRPGAMAPMGAQPSPALLPQRTLSPVSNSSNSAEDVAMPVRSRPAANPQRPATGSSTGASSLDLAALKAEKQRLHQMLRAYEKDFFKENKRQVSSFADIRPVASNYRRYKEIKKAIAAILQQQQGGGR